MDYTETLSLQIPELMTKQSIDLKYRCEGKLNRVLQKVQAEHGVQTSVPIFVRSATLKEGIRPRAGLLALGVQREQTGVKVKVEEAIEVLGDVWREEGLCDCMSPFKWVRYMVCSTTVQANYHAGISR